MYPKASRHAGSGPLLKDLLSPKRISNGIALPKYDILVLTGTQLNGWQHSPKKYRLANIYFHKVRMLQVWWKKL